MTPGLAVCANRAPGQPTFAALCSLEREILEGCRIGEARDPAEGRLADPRAHPAEERQQPDRRVDCLLVHQALHLFEDRGPLLRVEFGGLLLVEFVDLGIAAINVGTAGDDERGEPRRRVAEGAAGAAQYATGVLLAGVCRGKGGPL